MNIKSLKMMFFMLMLLTFPTFINANANADVCSKAKNDAAKVKASYKFMYKEGLPAFKITLSNMTKNIAAVDINGADNRTGVMYADAILESYTVQIPIYDYNYTCETPARIISIKLPQYNEYADMDICSDIKDYKYCQRILTEDIKISDIYDKLVAYKTALNKSNNQKQTTPKKIEEEFVLNEESKIYDTNKLPEDEVKKAKEETKKQISGKEKEEKTEKEKVNKFTIILSSIVFVLLALGIVMIVVYKKKKKKMVV